MVSAKETNRAASERYFCGRIEVRSALEIICNPRE